MSSGPGSRPGRGWSGSSSASRYFLFTVRRQSPVYLTESWQERYLRGLGYSVLALLLGPWGVPWGLIWTPWAVWVNLTGGVDETDAVLAWLNDRNQPLPDAG